MTDRMQSVRWWTLTTIVAGAIAGGDTVADSLRDDLTAAEHDRDRLATQVRDLGATPVAGTPGKDGAVGPSGPPGGAGLNGRDGATVTGPPGPSGAPGVSITGKPGKNGTNGISVTGPPGPAVTGPPGPTGAAGATVTGPPGEKGEKGDKGDKGDSGDTMTCPTGYTPTEVIIVPHPGTYLVCKKEPDH